MSENSELSERELEILRLVATGASNKEIAQQLYISANTVKVHLRNIFAKIDVTTRTEAAMYAVGIGLVQAESPPGEEESDVSPGSAETAEPQWRSYAGWVGLVVIVILALSAILIFTARQRTGQASASPVAPAEEARWQIRANLPVPRSGLGLSAFENRLYAIAGETRRGVSGVVEVYNPDTNSWADLADKPTPVADVSAAVVGGKIYIPGGRLDSGTMTDVLEIYDPLQDDWMRGANLPGPVSAYAFPEWGATAKTAAIPETFIYVLRLTRRSLPKQNSFWRTCLENGKEICLWTTGA